MRAGYPVRGKPPDVRAGRRMREENMSELYMMVSVLNKYKVKKISEFYNQQGISVIMWLMARGTAAGEILDYFGLEESTKVVLISLVTRETWNEVKKGLRGKLNIEVPGTGIVFIIPVSSIGGKKQLQFLTENQNFVKGEESSLKDTKYELLVVVLNQGYTELVMDAARDAGAGGGTAIHAKGTGMEGAKKFLGVSLAEEKEIVLIVVKSGDKNSVMRAIMNEAGLESKARAIVFSLPVTSALGMRLMESEPEE